MSQDDDTRAALWQAQQRRRVAYQAQLRAALAGDPQTHEAARKAWEPLTLLLLEANEPPPDPQLEVDPLGLSDQINVGL